MTDSLAAEARELINAIRDEARKVYWRFDAPPIEFESTAGDGVCEIISDFDCATFGMILDASLKTSLFEKKPTIPYREWLDAIDSFPRADEPLTYDVASQQHPNTLLRYAFVCNSVKRIGRRLVVMERLLAELPTSDVHFAFLALLNAICYRLAEQRLHPDEPDTLPWATFCLQAEDIDEDVLGRLEEAANGTNGSTRNVTTRIEWQPDETDIDILRAVKEFCGNPTLEKLAFAVGKNGPDGTLNRRVGQLREKGLLLNIGRGRGASGYFLSDDAITLLSANRR